MLFKKFKIEKINYKSKRYDISVEDNNNFFANGILIHNCQNLNGVKDVKKNIELWRDVEFVVSEKIDGTSASFVIHKSIFDACSREICLKEPENVKDSLYWDIASHFNIREQMERYSMDNSKDFAIQGEIAGAGVSDNRLKLPKTTFFLFNVFWIAEQRYCTFSELLNMSDALKIPTVPILNTSFKVGVLTVDEIIKMADGDSVLNANCIREGLVFGSKENDFKLSQFGRVSFKSISNEYILKHKL